MKLAHIIPQRTFYGSDFFISLIFRLFCAICLKTVLCNVFTNLLQYDLFVCRERPLLKCDLPFQIMNHGFGLNKSTKSYVSTNRIEDYDFQPS